MNYYKEWHPGPYEILVGTLNASNGRPRVVPYIHIDGSLTKPRNPINHDSWLIDRLSTSMNHPLLLNLHNAD